MIIKIFQQTIKIDGSAIEVNGARGLVIEPPEPVVRAAASATKLPTIIVEVVFLVIRLLTLVANATLLAIKLLALIAMPTIKIDGSATKVDGARGLVIELSKPAIIAAASTTKLPMIIVGAVFLVIGPLVPVANATFLAIKLSALIAGEASLTTDTGH